MRTLILVLTLLAGAAGAGTREAVEGELLPAVRGFEAAAGVLAAEAERDCRVEALREAYGAASDAWLAFGDFRFGPTETAAFGIAFWPDDRGFTQRTIGALLAAADPEALAPERLAEASVAGRGLLALDMLLGDPGLASYEGGSFACAVVQALARDLAAQAEALAGAWEAFAPTLLSAGEAGNATYLTEEEAVRAIYTQILAALGFSAEQRVGRPLGSFERPRPRLAEAWRSGRSLRNIEVSVTAAVDLAHALAEGPLPATEAAHERVRGAAAAIRDASLQDVEDPAARFRLEILGQAIGRLSDAIAAEIGAPLGIAPGFNAQDGD